MQLLGTSSGQRASANTARSVSETRSVSEAGVGPSPAPLDDTLPFPPPLHAAARSVGGERGSVGTERGRSSSERGRSGSGQRGVSLEQQTDALLERRRGARPAVERRSGAELTRSSSSAQAPLAPHRAGEVALGRLHWLGRELSPEFHEYALRVSRGEDLAPFRGKLWADDRLPLPWATEDTRPARRKAPRRFRLLLVGLALGALITSSVARVEEAPLWSPVASVASLAATLAGAPLVAAPAPPTLPAISAAPVADSLSQASLEQSSAALLPGAPLPGAPLPAAPVEPSATAPLSLALPGAPGPVLMSSEPPPLSSIASVRPAAAASALASTPPAAPSPPALSAPALSAPALSPPPPRAAQPRKVAAAPAVAAAPSESPLLVQEPPF